MKLRAGWENGRERCFRKLSGDFCEKAVDPMTGPAFGCVFGVIVGENIEDGVVDEYGVHVVGMGNETGRRKLYCANCPKALARIVAVCPRRKPRAEAL